MLLTSFFANLYYSKLAATVIQYLLFTIASDLPWKDCIVSQNITEEFNLVCVKNGALFKGEPNRFCCAISLSYHEKMTRH